MEQVRGAQKFAVLLCGLRENVLVEVGPLERRPLAHFEQLFVDDSPDGLNRYWRDASHGRISLSGSRVFDWRELPQSLPAYRNIMNRLDRIRVAAEHFAAPGPDQVHFPDFDGIVVVTDHDIDLTARRTPLYLDLNGQSRGYRVVICDQQTSLSRIAHEMGHSFGLDHAFSTNPDSCSPNDDGRPGAYCDRWDVMGAPSTTPSERFGPSGPLINAATMRLLGWLDRSRVRRFVGNAESFVLRPLSRPDLSGDLAVEFGEWLIEFRIDEGWDAGFGRPGVLVHQLVNEVPAQFAGDQHSLVLGHPNEFLTEGATFDEGDARVGAYRRVKVQSIDPERRTAVVSLLHREPARETGKLGVTHWIIEGVLGVSPQGDLVEVPPRDPIRDILVGLAVNELAETLTSSTERDQLQQASLQLIAETARRQLGQ